MNRDNPLDLCIEYIHQVWCMEDLKEGGMFAVYGIEQHRIELNLQQRGVGNKYKSVCTCFCYQLQSELF